MEEKQIHDDLASIRSLMERSSKFISLSGLSGVLAGVYALVGVGIIYFKLGGSNAAYSVIPGWHTIIYYLPSSTIWIAIGVLIASVVTCVVLSTYKAKKKGQQVWGPASKALLFNISMPLLAGGLFIIILLGKGVFEFIIPASLIFYGLALVSASNYTFGLVKYLGILQIALGLIAALLPGYGLLFWALGFGVLHIIYGSIMYFKYGG